ncbi:MAG: PTS sugar transporter subunit IIA [Candidatus Pacebacteria bacterium]|nr:PTS sugar transporter subunit IIA [Candidatus Paceibacterota bacterium]
MILTLKELANYLRVNERTILRMQEAGQIKGVKIGGQWRFNGSQIDQLFFPDASTTPSDETVPLSDLTRSHLAIPLSRVLKEDRMMLDLQASDTEGVIDELCGVLRQRNLILDLKDLQKRLLEREKLLSTGVGNGIALPHPRDPIPTLPEPVMIVVGRSEQGVAFEAVDGKPVHLFFLLCCQNIEMHLHMMGRLAHLLQLEKVAETLKECTQPEDVIRTVMEVERHDFLHEPE